MQCSSYPQSWGLHYRRMLLKTDFTSWENISSLPSKYIDGFVVNSKMSAKTVEYLHISELFTMQVYLPSNSTNVKFALWAVQLCQHINAQWSSLVICVFFQQSNIPKIKACVENCGHQNTDKPARPSRTLLFRYHWGN